MTRTLRRILFAPAPGKPVESPAPGVGWLVRRQVKAVGMVVGMLAVLWCLTACVSYEATHTRPDGSRTVVKGGSLLTNKGIGRAKVDGLGEIEGYSASPNAEVVREFGKGLGEGLRGAAVTTGPVR